MGMSVIAGKQEDGSGKSKGILWAVTHRRKAGLKMMMRLSGCCISTRTEMSSGEST
jgi:hypothetical protein